MSTASWLATPAEAIAWLRTPAAIRERCAMVLAAAEAGDTRHFAIDAGRLDAAADYVVETIRERHPSLDIPYHSRWRHFAAGGRSRWRMLADRLTAVPAADLARIRFDLVFLSVLLDAGAGEAWRYVEPETGEAYARSEGLAVASFDAFARGLFSARAGEPLRADAKTLATIDARGLGEAFQVRGDNPLLGLDGRVTLLNRLGAVIANDPEHFGRVARIGNLFDHLTAQALHSRLRASVILTTLLEALGPIWPGRIELAGVNLGDVGRHPAARSDDLTDSLVPLHKLSQWLAYSLIEPLEDAGIVVTGLEELTALAEYRNGGLLIDTGVLVPRHPPVLEQAHPAMSEVVVEWRALTVCLIDRLADRARERLGLTPEQLPLAKVLEGGTWAAGRRIARELRPDGAPPLRVLSDGTLF